MSNDRDKTIESVRGALAMSVTMLDVDNAVAVLAVDASLHDRIKKGFVQCASTDSSQSPVLHAVTFEMTEPNEHDERLTASATDKYVMARSGFKDGRHGWTSNRGLDPGVYELADPPTDDEGKPIVWKPDAKALARALGRKPTRSGSTSTILFGVRDGKPFVQVADRDGAATTVEQHEGKTIDWDTLMFGSSKYNTGGCWEDGMLDMPDDRPEAVEPKDPEPDPLPGMTGLVDIDRLPAVFESRPARTKNRTRFRGVLLRQANLNGLKPIIMGTQEGRPFGLVMPLKPS